MLKGHEPVFLHHFFAVFYPPSGRRRAAIAEPSLATTGSLDDTGYGSARAAARGVLLSPTRAHFFGEGERERQVEYGYPCAHAYSTECGNRRPRASEELFSGEGRYFLWRRSIFSALFYMNVDYFMFKWMIFL